ncbi:GNAT family N-acyltransferase [Sulfurimonas sp.]|uniref:GNAT family N-acyltransferase n=1 Tax=Sulfurimonas sp. TaxID=2022749 RepID=UPI0035623BC8
MDFKFLEVKDDDLLEKVFEFRYKILLDIYPEYLQNLNLKEEKEQDKYDQYSVHFVALDKHGHICATVRLIHSSPLGYPTENYMKTDNSSFQREKLGEMSRIFIDSKHRKLKTTKCIIHSLIKLIYIKMIQLDIEYTYGSLESNFLRLLKIYKLNYVTIGEEQKHKYFGLRHPCILYTKQLAADNPELDKTIGEPS